MGKLRHYPAVRLLWGVNWTIDVQGLFAAGFKNVRRSGLCQGTTLVVPKSPLFLSFRAGFSPRGTCFADFFSGLFSRAVTAVQDNGFSRCRTGAKAHKLV
jgi:hypothetical protein